MDYKKAEDALDLVYDSFVPTPLSNDILITDWSDTPQGDKIFECDGYKAGITKKSLPEYCHWLNEISNITPFDIEKTKLMSIYSTTHYAYIVQSHRLGSKKPLSNCITQLKRQGLLSTYDVMFTILVPMNSRDTELTHREISLIHQLLREYTDDDRAWLTGISKGRTSRIKSGVMVVLTLFIYDCMPGVEDKMKEY